ncbi:MAG: right-handed parallel beta-helix repeat-containing protein [Calditrichia bacterium]
MFYRIVFLLSLSLLCFHCSDREKNPGVTSPGTLSTESSTLISGSIFGTLSAIHSPYYVTGDLLVESDKTLTIEAGVKLVFADSARLEVRGELVAEGQPDNMITFTGPDEHWRGIKFVGSRRNSLLQFCIVENADWQDMSTEDAGAVNVESSSLTVQNCIFRNNAAVNGGGLILQHSEATIANSIFEGNTAVSIGGALLSTESSADIVNNTFYNNRCENYGGGLVVLNPAGGEVQNNIFYGNSANTGNPGITLAMGDSSHCARDYNFLAFGDMSPRFRSEKDLHLLPGSPCIDAGNPDAAFQDADGTRNDMGAYGGPQGDW